MTATLEVNAIPADPFWEVVLPVLAHNGWSLEKLSEWLEFHPDTMRKKITREDPTIPFDLADAIMCNLSIQQLWWQHPVLRELYYGVELDDDVRDFERGHEIRECSCPGCKNRFAVMFGRGYQRRRYCSRKCAQRHRRNHAAREAA